MSGQMLLLNPRRRRKSGTKKRKSNPSARRVARRTARRVTRRSNPMTSRMARRVMRRSRRRSNPINLGGSARSAITMFKEALIGGAGAVGVDLLMGQANKFLPASLQRVPGTVGAGDLVKAVLTVMVGKLLSRPTRGLSMKAAQGALTVQAHGLIANMMPGTMTLGYSVAARVAPGSNRIGPNARMLMNRYTAPGVSPVLNRFTAPGVSPLLSGSRNAAMAREGVMVR